ncbi:epidermal growth factor receptor substrate 15-like 1 isoform X4, partial [Tachysurus ichikawai]
KSTPTNLSGSVDSAKSSDPFQPFGSDANDPFQNKKGPSDPFSGKDPFAPSASSKATKDSSLGFADFSSINQLREMMKNDERGENPQQRVYADADS